MAYVDVFSEKWFTTPTPASPPSPGMDRNGDQFTPPTSPPSPGMDRNETPMEAEEALPPMPVEEPGFAPVEEALPPPGFAPQALPPTNGWSLAPGLREQAQMSNAIQGINNNLVPPPPNTNEQGLLGSSVRPEMQDNTLPVLRRMVDFKNSISRNRRVV